jgi:hypothetical protein
MSSSLALPVMAKATTCTGTTLPVQVPSGLRHDDMLELPLDPFGWPAGRLFLHVAIRAA